MCSIVMIVIFMAIFLRSTQYTDAAIQDFIIKDIKTQNATDSLDSLIQENLNCTENTGCLSKSRRKRYVAFPEGSSFSVKNTILKMVYVSFI